ncbi:type II toxin-antitoxin system RelE/ParE family toxin [Maricaulis sp.]|uniref:type II toxin-antitoxin system RelE/ParE family toxin n=1 Tax=Maricaulis sp. TaxID=1486257 RepID=UPI003A922828
MGFKLTRAAENDLISIYLDGAERFGLSQADHYHDSLDRLFGFLGQNPRAARDRVEITPPVRCHPHGSHLIIYVIDADDDVLVLRIRHAHENWAGDPG